MNRLQHLKKGMSKRHYLITALGSLMILCSIVIGRNIEVVLLFYNATHSIPATFSYGVTLHGSLFTMFTKLGAAVIVLFSFLLSLNIVLLIQYIRRKRSVSGSTQATAAGVGGTVAAVLGIGCASCGTAVLFSVLSVFGAGGLLLWLPLHGEEFSLIGAAAMIYSVWYILGKFRDPAVCAVR